MRTEQIRLLLMAALLLAGGLRSMAQSAFSLIEQDRNFAAGSYGLYPDKDLPQQTPAPKGYKPFYISHYGRHGSRYLSDMKAYKLPTKMLHDADSLGKLTAFGQMAYREMRLNLADAEGRWGDLTDIGKRQQSAIAHRMLQNYPEVFSNGAFVDARSTIVTRCVLSMGSFVLQLVKERPKLQVSMQNSYSDMWYLNHQDKTLRDGAMSPRVQKLFNKFIITHWSHYDLLNKLFNDTAYVNRHVDKVWLPYYLGKAAIIQRNTNRGSLPNPLLDIFSSEDVHLFWQIENVYSYIQSGFFELNGAKQPYVQLSLLRQIIHEADSISNSKEHGASLRFGHETVLMPLVCLMGINGYDYKTADLTTLEQKGWWASKVYPMSGNLQLVFYRKNKKDRNPLVKVLVNEREATLPFSSDIAPYYRWSDFRDYYLQKIATGESALRAKR